ncbi:MAG: hypothetical protein PHY23_09400 [Oscillospiraceae bacterium]|jgi:hypothetical protein|nr:hypothetical protein [Oscillospiraceae bacterium]
MENQSASKGTAIASLVLGIVSLVLAWFGYFAIVGIVAAIVGIVLSVSAKKALLPQEAGIATAGMVCSIVGLCLSAIVFITWVSCISVAASMGLMN